MGLECFCDLVLPDAPLAADCFVVLSACGRLVSAGRLPAAGRFSCCSGRVAVGFLGFDCVRYFERVPLPEGPVKPEGHFLLVEDTVIMGRSPAARDVPKVQRNSERAGRASGRNRDSMAAASVRRPW